MEAYVNLYKQYTKGLPTIFELMHAVAMIFEKILLHTCCIYVCNDTTMDVCTQFSTDVIAHEQWESISA